MYNRSDKLESKRYLTAFLSNEMARLDRIASMSRSEASVWREGGDEVLAKLFDRKALLAETFRDKYRKQIASLDEEFSS